MAATIGETSNRRAWSDEELIADLENASVNYFVCETNRDNGLIRDRSLPKSPASIAAIGMGLTALPLGVERKALLRDEVAEHVLKILRFLWRLPQGEGLTRRATRAFSITSWKSRPGDGAGTANCRPSTRHF